jgi:hypothetical protein
MNERYQGEGPGGKTRKSAAKLKPKTAAASSVHVESKPTTRQERKAARRRREAEEKRKAEERARKAAARERKALEAAGETPPEPKKLSLLDRLFPKKSGPAVVGKSGGSATVGTARGTSSAGATTRQSTLPTSKRYKDLRRIYWILIGAGVVCVAAAFFAQTYYYDRVEIWGVPMGAAYVLIIAALILDFTKTRPLVKAHQKQMSGGSGRKSPKQVKHEEEAAERARQIEEFNKAKKQARRLSRRQAIGLAPKSKVSGEAEGAGAAGAAEETGAAAAANEVVVGAAEETGAASADAVAATAGAAAGPAAGGDEKPASIAATAAPAEPADPAAPATVTEPAEPSAPASDPAAPASDPATREQ